MHKVQNLKNWPQSFKKQRPKQNKSEMGHTKNRVLNTKILIYKTPTYLSSNITCFDLLNNSTKYNVVNICFWNVGPCK